MAHPAFRWSRLLPITALLVVTTGLAAAPIRQAWLPIVARPLGLTIGAMPKVSAPALMTSNETVRRDNAELAAAFTSAPDRQQALASSTSFTEAAASRPETRPAGAPAWATSGAYRRGSNSASGTTVGSRSGSAGFGGSSGGLLGTRAASSIGPPRSYPKTEARLGGSGGGSGSGSVSGGGSGGGSGNGSGNGRGSTVADDIFKDHKSGMPDLTGKGGNGYTVGGGGGPTQGGLIGGAPNLAANPEPSTILLLGTGLVAVAGAVRRRMRG